MSNPMRIESKKQSPPIEAVPAEAVPPAALAPAPVQPPSTKARRPLMRRPPVVILIALLAIAGIIFGALILVHMMTHESTDDAFIDGHVILIAPKIAGKVLTVNVKDNQEVKAGDTLLEIDPRDYKAVVDQKQAAFDVAVAKEKSAEASVAETDANIQTMQQGMESLNASRLASQLSASLSHSDLSREQSLIKTGVVSAQDFEHSKSAADTADANLVAKVKEVDAAMAYVNYAKAQKASAQSQETAAQAEVDQARAELAQAQLQLSYTTVTAPEDGRVTSKTVEVGDYLQVGQTLLAVVPHEVWVTANLKETQITYMRPGQPALVEVDAYPSRKLRAHVDSIQAGSGARFSLLPPENATGNFVKVVQRVPVKIVFDEQPEVQRVLGPGMSAVPVVQVRSAAGPGFVVAIFAAIAILAVIVAAFWWLGKCRRERSPVNNTV